MIRRQYTTGNDLAQAEAVYKLIKWVYDDPNRATEVGSKLVGLGLAVLGIACIAAALKEY